MGTKAELVLDTKSELGEGALWYDNVLLWVDINPGLVFMYDPVSGTNREIRAGQSLGTVVPREQGGLAVAVEGGFGLLDPETETLTILEDPESDLPNTRMNDGKCDPQGRFWAGSLDNDEKNPIASLYCMDIDHTLHKRLDGVTISNGIVWTKNSKTMYYIDTPTNRVDAFDFDPATGEIANRRTAVDIPEELGWPDGMAIDENENVWVAMWGGNAVTHWDPRTGEQLGSISVPASQVTSCAFGGPDLDVLYITSARIGLSEEPLSKEPHAGSLFKADPGVRGVPTFAFKG